MVYQACKAETKSTTVYIQFMIKINNEKINMLYNAPLALFNISTLCTYTINFLSKILMHIFQNSA